MTLRTDLMKTTKLMALAAMPIALGLLACEVEDDDGVIDMAADSAVTETGRMAGGGHLLPGHNREPGPQSQRQSHRHAGAR